MVLLHGTCGASAGQDAAAGKPGRDSGPRPGVDCADRIDLGELHVDAIAQASLSVAFKGIDGPRLSLQIEVPQFVSVKEMHCVRHNLNDPRQMHAMVILELDTRSVGKRAGTIKAQLGDQEVSVPVVATVVAQEPGRTKVLVVSSGFGSRLQADSYRPWFDFVRQANLDVSYMESRCFPRVSRGPRGPNGLPAPPAELARQDVILLADGGTVFLTINSSLMLMQCADAGKRVIVTASPAMVDSVLHANRILDSSGMVMIEHDVPTPSDAPRRTIAPIEAGKLEHDELLEGVKTLSRLRPAPIRIRDPEKARILAYLPDSQDGLVAVSRQGKGEVVAVGGVGLAEWVGEYGEGTDNARFLRNLLTPRPTR